MVIATRGFRRSARTFAIAGTEQTTSCAPFHQNATGTTRGSPSRPV
jgi:hypothetical protein